jgi:hypothetical protein
MVVMLASSKVLQQFTSQFFKRIMEPAKTQVHSMFKILEALR